MQRRRVDVAAAGWADDAHNLALGYGQVDILQDVKRAKMLVQALDLDHRARRVHGVSYGSLGG